MQHRNGDLFTTDAKIIAHGANTVGVMGAGVAKTVREKFPRVFDGYRRACNHGLCVPGEWQAIANSADLLVVNLFTQDNPGPNARYEWIFSSLADFVNALIQHKLPYGNLIAIPEIGSGIGGLEYKHVEKILQLVEDIYPQIEFEVWHYEPNQTSSTEPTRSLD